MEHLVAMVDGFVYSHSVCDNAAWIAEKTGAAIEVLHVLEDKEGPDGHANLSGTITLGARTALLEELSELDAQRARVAQKLGRSILDAAKERIGDRTDVQIATRLRTGNLADTVTSWSTKADLLVVGKRGEFADFETLNLGANLEGIARASSVPVFVAAREFRPVKRFLLAFDGGTSAMKAVDYVSRSELFAGLECHLLMVGDDRPGSRRTLENAKALLSAGSFDVKAEIKPGRTGAVISRAVSEGDIDLLVMGAYSHSRFRSMIFGSTTSEMLRDCKIPIVLIR